MQSGEFSDILEQIDPESYLDHLGVTYRRTAGRSGPQLNVRQCPRCGGTGWKVFLNAETGLGSCFHGDCVGQPGFNLWSFTAALVGREQAAPTLLEHAGVGRWRPRRKKIEVTTPAVSWGDIALPESIPMPFEGRLHKYLVERGITERVAKTLRWRFSLRGHYDYVGHDGRPAKQSYAHRILIPVFNLEGRLVTFQGRDTTGTGERKYLFPPGLPGTGMYFYNAHNAIGSTQIVIAEGAFDVAAVLMALQEDPTLECVGVVGSFGKDIAIASSGECQFSQLVRLRDAGLQGITMMWDGEPGTILKAATKGLEVQSKLGIPVRLARLPLNKDPNEVSAEVVRKTYRDAITLSKQAVMRLMSAALFQRTAHE